MLTIRRVQMDALAAVALEAFEARLAAFLEEREPARIAALGEGGLPRFVREGIARARGYGIASERDVLAFVGLLLERGASFGLEGKDAWAGAIFARAGVPAAMRLEKVKQRLAAEDEIRASRASARGAERGGGDAGRA